jgi:ketosteroid isomerase-like protein
VLANAEVKWAVFKAVDTLLHHIANGRLRETMACFSEDADVALFGSEASDRAIGAPAIRQHFADFYAKPFRIIFTFPDRRVSAHGNVAWFTGEGSYRLSTADVDVPYRLTGVLERRREQWLWQLFSGSEPRQAVLP